ncbi:dioxygenase [Actinomadura sp. CNU-125]|uniref:dioxygenase family protein n=1 Tax=Actinomadura sp. CNU-125 TaxID=1904961 RepID=UPI00095B33FB|nr:class III extradiol ring-cleavage dioxygenase [Actinomadura sp. CNU-125]OLT38408.1 dioxygenase [Actinomadura sp. CNU-125]
MSRMPVLYLSHGAPPLADDPVWTDELARWAAELPKPEAVLMVSAHWEEAPTTLSATRPVPLVYDFWGFPERYYRVRYDAPAAPELAADVRALLPGTRQDDERGLDHGAYVPLVEMYPDADVPVLQMSMPTLEPERLFEVGRALAPLREQGVLIVGSGFTTHNLREMRPGADAAPPAWSAEFDAWTDAAVAAGDVDALLDFRAKAPAARIAHPRTEHFAPLFVALGADAEGGTGADASARRSVIDGYWFGLAKRSFQFG